MSSQMSLWDIPNAISSPESAAGRLHFDSQAGRMTNQCGLAVALASLSPRQAKGLGLLTRATSGPHGSGSSSSAALSESMENRLRQRLPTAGGMMWPQIWKAKATPAGRQYCQLAVSATRTKGIDCGLWATPNTMDNLPPRSQEAKDRQFNTTRKGRTAPANLREQVNPSMWPTPNAGDDRDRGRWEDSCVQRRVAMGKQISLSMIAQSSNGSSAPTGNRGQLSVDFVSWLMGYSTAHLSSMRLAMQSYRSLRRNSSRRRSKS